MQNDNTLMSVINQMMYTLGASCQSGNSQACNGYNYVQSAGNYMMSASNACSMGDRNACNAYAQGYQQLNQDYALFSRQYAGAGMPQPGGSPGYNSTHEQRMRDIQNFGANNTKQWQNNMNRMDRNHDAFMNSLRN